MMDRQTLEIFFEHVRNVANAIASGIIPELPPDPGTPEPPGDTDRLAAVVVNAAGLNVRSMPSIDGAFVRWLDAGTVVEVLLELEDGADVWAWIGEGEYCAMLYGGKRYLEYV